MTSLDKMLWGRYAVLAQFSRVCRPFLSHESLRVVLSQTKRQLIKVVPVSRGTLNEALSHPREIFKPVIVFNAYALILVQNHPSGDPSLLKLTRRILEASKNPATPVH